MRSGAGLLVPLQGGALGCCFRLLQLKWCVHALWSWHVGAIAGCCCCRIFLRSTRRRSPWRVVAKKRFVLTKHKFCPSKWTKELGSLRYDLGMIRAWFGVWFGNPILLNSGSFVDWVFSPTVNLPRLLLNGSSGSTWQATLQRTSIWRIWRSKYTSMRERERERESEIDGWMDGWMDGWVDSRPGSVDTSLAQLSLGSAKLRLMFLFDGFLVWLPAN